MNIYNHPSESFQYICTSEIDDKYKAEFELWLNGQTRPLVDEHEDAAYLWDWERWLKWKCGENKLLIWD